MKHTNFLWLFLFCCIHQNIAAQSWTPKGSEWIYSWSLRYAGGQTRVTYNEDKVIDGVLCQKFESQTYEMVNNHLGNPIAFYTHYSNDTLYKWNPDNENFEMLWTLNAEVGDVWAYDNLTSARPCGEFGVVVDSVGTIMRYGKERRFVRVVPDSFGEDTLYDIIHYKGMIIEGVGMTGTYFTPLRTPCSPTMALRPEQICYTNPELNSICSWDGNISGTPLPSFE